MGFARSRAVLLVFAALCGFSVPAAAEQTLTVGTAGVTGVYYPAGGAICRLVNRNRKESGIRCVVESTDGSINNLEALRKRELEMGIVQSDMLYHAYDGSDNFAQVGADRRLRILFALHSEPFTVIARKNAKIKTFDDLKGKRVNFGLPGSGMRATMEELMTRKGWTEKSFAAVAEIKSSDQAAALCAGRIDAMVFAAGHPNGAVEQVTSTCDTRLVDVTGPVIDRMIADDPFYSRAVIPGGMYNGNPQDTRTFGVRAILVTTSGMSEETAYEIVRDVFDNLDNFKTLHPVFATLDARRMVSDADMAPLHPGALRYFREKGLVD